MSNPFDDNRDSNALPGAAFAFADPADAVEQHDAFAAAATAATQHPTDRWPLPDQPASAVFASDAPQPDA